MSEWIKLKAQDGNDLGAYKAVPAGEPKGAVVVVQEIFGVNAHIRSIADRLAAAGYVAIAPALFDRYQRGVELKYEGDDLKAAYELYGKLNVETALLDVAAGFQEASASGKATAVIGFCYGGLMTWLAATRGVTAGMKPACCVAYYPGGIGNFATETPQCPVLLQFGAEDTHIGQDQVDAVKAAHPELPVWVYEGAGHGFNCDMRESFDPKAAGVAWERTMLFLAEHVQG